MLYEICLDLRNFFDKGQPKLVGDVDIVDGKITQTAFTDLIQDNQYFRIIGSVFNDGVYQYTSKLSLTDETFSGTIQLMAVPKEFLDLVKEISDWQDKYGKLDSASMSPYSSESFGGYSYSKSSGGGENGISGSSWKAFFGDRLNRWRKI